MSVNFVLMEINPDTTAIQPYRSIGEAEFTIVPRVGEFVNLTPETESESVMFEVVAAAHAVIGGSGRSGDLFLRRIGRSAEFHKVLKVRVAK